MAKNNRNALVLKMHREAKAQNYERAEKIKKQIVRLDMSELNRKPLMACFR